MSDNENMKEIIIKFDKERLKAIEIYGEPKHLTVMDELLNSLESLYVKTVPQSVRAYIAMKQQMSSNHSDNNRPSDEGDGS